MRRLLPALSLLILLAGISSAQKLTAKDLRALEGNKWVGTLTYLDYRSNKKTTIKSNVTITRRSDAHDTWVFTYEYPDEPKANRSSEAKLEDSGAKFFGETVVEKSRGPGKALRLVTTQAGTDNDREALFRYTYSITANSFSIKKEVRLAGSADWFERNEYRWTR